MNTKTRWMLGLVGLVALVGCGDADDPQDTGTQNEGIACGSAALHESSHDVCGAMDAKGDGASCRCVMGFVWDGDACVSLSGCSCLGTDCDKVSETEEDCQLAHAACGGSTPSFLCGSATLFEKTHAQCDAMDVKAEGDANGDCFCMLGFAWNGSSCESLANCACEGADCDKLTETQEACEQAHATCTTQPPALHCGSSELFSLTHDQCGAMDAESAPDEAGSCNCMLGFKWNGSSCEALADCQCIGNDCDKLTQSIEECEQAHASCTPSPPQLHCGASELYSLSHNQCDAMDAKAVPDDNGSSCFCFLGFAWDGNACVELADCACEGADCSKLTQSQAECEQAHAGC